MYYISSQYEGQTESNRWTFADTGRQIGMSQTHNQMKPGKTKSHGHHRMAILTTLQLTLQTPDLFFSVRHTNVRTACGGTAKCLRSWAWHWMELLLLAAGLGSEELENAGQSTIGTSGERRIMRQASAAEPT
jgi:hypothetical protein